MTKPGQYTTLLKPGGPTKAANSITCEACGKDIHFQKTGGKKPDGKPKYYPVDARGPYVRGRDEIARGTYTDGQGGLWNEDGVPEGLEVWRIHFGDCPRYQAGAEKLRASARAAAAERISSPRDLPF